MVNKDPRFAQLLIKYNKIAKYERKGSHDHEIGAWAARKWLVCWLTFYWFDYNEPGLFRNRWALCVYHVTHKQRRRQNNL